MNARAIAARFAIGHVIEVTPAPTQGFSGSQLFRVTSDAGTFALKTLPPGYPVERLHEIHRVLAYVVEHGCSVIAAPLRDMSGQTVICQGNTFWEMTPWMPGTADFNRCPSTQRLANIMREVARFHAVAATYQQTRAVSPGIRHRIARLHEVSSPSPSHFDLPHLPRAIADRIQPWLERGCRAANRRIQQLKMRQMTDALDPLVLQPISRDLWHDHVLFLNDEVSGIVDFHAMRVDTPLLDLARLIGSLKIDGRVPWPIALEEYQRWAILPEKGISFLVWLHACGVALSFVNWIKWLVKEKRAFAQWTAVVQRIETLVQELEHGDEI